MELKGDTTYIAVVLRNGTVLTGPCPVDDPQAQHWIENHQLGVELAKNSHRLEDTVITAPWK